jgi:purine-nucleoside phosphorylase
MHLLGIRSLIVSNASGGIHSRFESGQVVLIDSHIDLMFRNPIAPGESASGSGLLGVPHRNGRQAYDSEWMDVAQQAGLRLGYALARGTYLATLGPNYETRAEYRFFAKIGADMVGMSTVPEVLLARQLGLRVLAFSIITNVAKPDAPSVTHHEEVLDWSRKAQDRLIPIIQTIIDKVGSTDATNNRPS